MFDLSEILEFVSSSQIGSNFKLPYLNSLIQSYDTGNFLIDKSGTQLPAELLTLGKLLLNRATIIDSSSDIDRSIEYLTRAAQVGLGEPNVWVEAVNLLSSAHRTRFQRYGKAKDIDSAIEYLSHIIPFAENRHDTYAIMIAQHGSLLLLRFEISGGLNDLQGAIECCSHAWILIPEGDENRTKTLNNLGNSYKCRFERLGELEDINKAIDCQTQAVHLTPNGHPDMPSRFNNLGNSYARRFERLGELEDISRAIDCQSQAVHRTPNGHPDMPGRFNNLGTSYLRQFERLGELEDISKAIDSQTQAVHLTPNGHPDMPSGFNNLGNSYKCRFERLGELEDISKAIDCAIRAYTRALEVLSGAHMLIPTLQLALGQSHLTRGVLFGDSHNMAKALEYFIASACSSTGPPSVRLDAAKSWANLSLIIYPSNTLQAHHTAMLLLPELIWLGTTSARRYECITEVGAVAVEAAAAAISAKKYDLALEWLEQGRSIVWTQTLQLRMPYDVLSPVDPKLSQQLQHVSRELELASQRTPSNIIAGSDPMTLEQATLRHQHLTHQYEKLVAQARELPGFHDFMLPKTAAELKLAARSGPVVVVNIHAEHCDALILSPQSNEVAHVPLPELSHSELSRLHNLMLTTLKAKSIRERAMARLKELDGDHFKHILTTLWHKLVKPVLDFLGYTSKPSGDQLPHITWCTTGALSFLPIHAAGDYDSGGDRIFDFVVTSYTPTLSALLPSPTQPVESASGVLAVSQESTPGLSTLPGTKLELARIKERLGGLPHMQLENSQAIPQAVLEAMDKYECVHLACHGSQHADNPTQSCFHLHGGTLTLEQIAQRDLKNKRLAFLSACQTAKGDQKFPDEAIHLAAGMLVAGYPSVIATMWSISDCDAPLVADQVYSRLVSGGVLDCSQVGRALHAAVGALREDVGETSFSRWVPYIHIGK
ncbi:hypothetical protein BDV93DRAFT_454084 [Ceratobasidium sp. AG-I]|nr:hypothetical protein BDV93DRAFT_454084 [Ceratobasidium sp. AG-I]